MTTVLTRMVARLLLVPILMVAAAILVKGYVDVGDGFAAGVIAALGVLLQYLAIGGLLVALAVVFVPVLLGQPPLRHAPPPGAEVIHLGSLELLTAVLFDAGVFALVLGMVVATIHLIASTPNERGGRP